jgi:hypothetical protein
MKRYFILETANNSLHAATVMSVYSVTPGCDAYSLRGTKHESHSSRCSNLSRISTDFTVKNR